VVQLDQVIDRAVAENSRLALFPAMYRTVTAAMDRAVSEGGFFDDDDRLERLAVQFAGYYLGAYSGFRSGAEICRCWHTAFSAAESPRRRSILQHLLLGMNAHINFDLGIATVRVAGDDLASMYGDFVRVNEILMQLVDQLQATLSDVSPGMGLIDRMGWNLDEAFMRLSIRAARDHAWDLAERIASADDPAPIITERDDDSCLIANLVIRRWSPVSLFAWLIAFGETSSVGDIVDALRSIDIDLELAATRSRDEMASPPAVSSPLRDAIQVPGRRIRARR
jgi:hypothetical protein